MNKDDIAMLRQSIIAEYDLKMKQLKIDKENELKALSRLGSRLEKMSKQEESQQSNLSFPETKETGVVRMVRTKKPKQDITTPTTRELLRSALNEIDEAFTREDIKAVAETLADAEIKDGTFAPIFADLVKKGEIVEIGKKENSNMSLYERNISGE